jgi:hypothetical protein
MSEDFGSNTEADAAQAERIRADLDPWVVPNSGRRHPCNPYDPPTRQEAERDEAT